MTLRGGSESHAPSVHNAVLRAVNGWFSNAAIFARYGSSSWP